MTITSRRCERYRAVALALPLLSGCGAPAGVESADSASPAQEASAGRARDFSLRDTTGRTVRLSDFLGSKVILLNFWATWCVPCAGELPHLQRLYETHKDSGLVVLGISMDGPESIAEVAPRAQSYGVTFPILLDEETRVVGTYNPTRAAPYNVLIAFSGAIAMTREGYSSGDELKLEADVLELLRAAR